ncbi:SGNH/GDSL hydrolase family protein [Lewinella sp. LCG006]|uniref:SGNH/GDSL hydrolase family protein n=1 Tax=Lewinella sp. LCG006 TaxID=3231911 RepID=UPI0034607C7D
MRPKVLFFFLLILLQMSCGEQRSEAKNGREVISDRPWKLICLGGDWTVGVGLPPEEAYPALLAEQLSTLLPVKVVNAGIKGESVSGAADRVDWLLQQRLDALLIQYASKQSGPLLIKELQDWEKLLKKVRLAYPELPVIVATAGTASHDNAYLKSFEQLLKRVDAQWEIINVPHQEKEPKYWQGNGEYLSQEGQRILAEQLFPKVASLVTD